MESNGRARQLFSTSNFPIRKPVLASPAWDADGDQLCSPAVSMRVDQADPLSNQDDMSGFSLRVDAGQSSVAGTVDAYSEGPISGLQLQQSQHEQHQRGIHRYLQFESDKASKNSGDMTHDTTSFALPDRLECSSSPNLSQFQYTISMPSPAGDFHALLDSDLCRSGDISIPGPADLAVDILQHSSAVQFPHFNIQVAPSQSSQPSRSFDVVEELHQMAPERIKKRSRNNNETNGCKHCNCKRSRCLKLYCECFSTGFYCTDSCSCEGCLNKPDYEDTVLDIRKQIELRNPHAFAPKVSEQGTSFPANTMEESSSARHKRGCNCKKSKCVKKYCECYQANVGCSEECRCENCENPFGTKAKVMHRRSVNQENQSPEQLDVMKTRNKSARIGRSNQSSPKRGSLSDISNMASISHPCLGSLALAPRSTLHQETGLCSLAGHPIMQFTPKFDGSLPIDNFPPNGVYASPVIDHTFRPIKTLKGGSSNDSQSSPVSQYAFVPSSFALKEQNSWLEMHDRLKRETE